MGKIRIEKKITMIGNEDDDIVLQALIEGHCDFVRRLRKEAQQQEQQQQQNSNNNNRSNNRNVVTVFDTVAEESRSKSNAPKEGAKKRKQIMYDEKEATLVSASTKRLRKEAVVNVTTELTKQPIAPSSPSSGGNTNVGAEEKEEKYYSFKKSAQIVPMTPRRQEAKTTTAYHLHRGSEKQQ